MREMKDSGNPWVGNIPKNWQIIPLKYIIKYNTSTLTDAMPCDYEFDYVDIGSVTYGKGIEQFQRMEFKDAPLRARRVVECGDVILSTVRTYLKAVAAIPQHDYPIVVSTGFVVMKALDNTDSGFLKYAVQSDSFVSDIEARSYGVSYPAINASDAVRTSIPLPSIDEQKIIAQFLDSKCAEIDALSNDIQSEIDTLEAYKRSVITEAVTKGLDKNAPMKDSGIEWVGEIPEHCNVDKGKYCLDYVQKPTKPDDDVITCFRDGEVTLRRNRREEGFTISLKEIGYQGIDVGDLIVHGMDGFAGAIGISDSRGKASPVLNVLDTSNNKRYVMYYLRSLAFNGVFLALATGIRVRTCDTNWGKLRELLYVLPPKQEQDEIVAFIDDRLNATDEIIAQKQEQLAVLAEYKKSVIYEYVTGKKEVPVA